MTKRRPGSQRKVFEDLSFLPKGDKSPEYRTWASMIQRCTNEKATGYENYGGRGVSVCAEWRWSFVAFYKHVGPRPATKQSIDRYPNKNGNYEPGNVRWATRGEQNRNHRRNNMVKLGEETLCLTDWCVRLKMPMNTVRNRMKRGMTVERALTAPLGTSS